jgi:predicted Ser/Thr protein kinase
VSASGTEVQHLGPYRLVERIGEGGMGVVHLAVAPDRSLVAVKVLRPWLVGGRDGRNRFEREVAVLQKVRGPRVAEIVDADVNGDPPFVVTRYIRGNPLEKVVADHGPLRGDALARLASGLAEAVATVHSAGVLHRDIKPGNVMLTDDGPVLIDFGLARAADETRLTATGLVIGTPRYLAPEIVAGHPPSTATDVHGWAATVAFAATGRPPYGEGHDSVVLDRIRRGQFDLAGVDDRLAPVLARALAADPGYRPTLNEVRHHLDSDPDATVVVAPAPEGPTLAAAPPPVVVPQPPAPAPSPAGPTRPPAATEIVRPTGPPTRVDYAPASQPARQAPPPAARYPEPRAQPGGYPPAGQYQQRSAPHAAPYWAGPNGMAAPLRTWPARLAVAAGWFALLILFAMEPPLGVAVLFVLMVLARTTWRVRRSLYERRIARGHQPSDHWVMAAGAPWHLMVTAVQSAFHLIWIVLAAYLAGAVVSLGERPGPRLPYLIGAAVALSLAWFGPGTPRIRHGVRALTAPLDRSARAAWITFGVLAALSWILLLIWDGIGSGWPLLDGLRDLVNDLVDLARP